MVSRGDLFKHFYFQPKRSAMVQLRPGSWAGVGQRLTRVPPGPGRGGRCRKATGSSRCGQRGGCHDHPGERTEDRGPTSKKMVFSAAGAFSRAADFPSTRTLFYFIRKVVQSKPFFIFVPTSIVQWRYNAGNVQKTNRLF